jgi:hypothetical protein
MEKNLPTRVGHFLQRKRGHSRKEATERTQGDTKWTIIAKEAKCGCQREAGEAAKGKEAGKIDSLHPEAISVPRSRCRSSL